MLHAVTNHLVDAVLALILMVGGVTGAQFGARAGQKIRSEHLRLLLGLLILTALLAGCENSNIFSDLADKSSLEARTEAALMALDDGDYQTAISILEDLVAEFPNDPLLWQYLSNAHSGSAGLDTLNLLQVLDDLETMDESGSIDMIGLVLGDNSGELTAAEIADKLLDIDTAIDSLDNIANPDDDQTILRGLLGVTRIGITMAQIVSQDTGQDPIELTEDGISGLYGGTPDFSQEVTWAIETALSDDLAAIGAAVVILDQLSDTNDLSDDFDLFEADIDQDNDDNIDAGDLQNYVGAL